MIYQIYYNLESSESYLLLKDADNVTHIHCLKDLIKKLKSSNDIIFVYLPQSKQKIELRLSNSLYIEVMIYNSVLAGVFIKEFKIDEADKIVNSFNEYVNEPKEYGFVFEPW